MDLKVFLFFSVKKNVCHLKYDFGDEINLICVNAEFDLYECQLAEHSITTETMMSYLVQTTHHQLTIESFQAKNVNFIEFFHSSRIFAILAQSIQSMHFF